jgi:AcrR family transcriptional regulator
MAGPGDRGASARAATDDAGSPALTAIPANSWEGRVLDRSLGKARQRSLERASGLVEAAARLMERTRGDAFTVQDVTTEAGQSLRSFYHHFGSKDDLFVAVFEEAMRVYARLLRQAVDKHADPLDRLIAGAVAVARLSRKSSQGLVVVMSRLRLRLTEADPEKVAESTREVTDILRQLVTDALDAGVAHDCDADTVAFSLFALGSSLAVAHFLGNTFALNVPDDADFVRFCLQGAKADFPGDWMKRQGRKD